MDTALQIPFFICTRAKVANRKRIRKPNLKARCPSLTFTVIANRQCQVSVIDNEIFEKYNKRNI